MWTIFKLLNLFSVFITAFIWFTALLPLGPLMLMVNVGMIVCLPFLPVKYRFDARIGCIILALLAMVVWTIANDDVSRGLLITCMYLPVLYVIPLPREYQKDLLRFVTKWIAISLIPGLLIYWATLFVSLPSMGMYNYPSYDPFINYIFYLKSTHDTGMFVRFNAYLLEPGHLAMMCEFFLMANRFDFKKNPWMWIMVVAIMFSFSLAGYLICFTGFVLLKVNTIGRGLAVLALLAGFIIGVQNFSGGDNAVNQLIIDRLKYDEEKGIQGNNRFFNNTDYEYEKALKTGDYWAGVSGKANMALIGGSGFKIYILKYGLVGIFLVLIFYITLIPPRPDWHFTLAFLFILALCFVQNSYPGWTSWLLPYVLGLDIYSKGGPYGDDEPPSPQSEKALPYNAV